MQCQTCRAVIPNGATRCPECGFSVTNTSTPFETRDYELEREAIPYIPYRPLLTAPNNLPASNTSAAQTAQQPQSSGIMQPQQPPMQERFVQNTPLLTRTGVYLLVLLAVLIVGGSGSILVFGTVLHPVELQANATVVTQSIVSVQIHATVNALVQSPQNVYNRVTRTSPSFNDHLDNQAASKWSPKNIGTANCIFNNGAYHLRLTPRDLYIACPAAGTNYHNFIYQVQMTIINGLDAGISFRSTNVTLPSFLFTITTTGLYSLYVSPPSRILAFGRSSAINTGLKQTNLLTVMAQDSVISLFINKQFVKSVNNNEYSSGEIGVIADNEPDANIDIAFSNAQVWVLP
jgi:hypothetical protein